MVSSATRTPLALAMLTPEVLILPFVGEYWTYVMFVAVIKLVELSA